MWTVVTDIPVIRQKRLHHLVDDENCVQWSGEEVTGALAYAFLQHQTEVRMEGGEYRFILTIWPEFDGTPHPEPANDPGEKYADALGPFTPTAVEPPRGPDPTARTALEQAADAARNQPETLE